MKVLIVEDDANSRVFLERALLSQGYSVVSAANGIQALEKAVLSPPDLIISDILMPEMDGFELCRRVKTDERLHTIPFVFYTATYTDKKDEELAMSLGASRFFVKPMEPEVFFEKIREVIQEHKAQTLPLPGSPLADMRELDRMQIEALARKLDKKVRDLESERGEVRKIHRDWEDIFQAIGHPTIILDAHHNILSVNRATVKAAGAGSAEELIGKKCFEIFHNTAEPPGGCPLVKMLSSCKLEEGEMEVEALGGVFLVSCTPVFDEQGGLQKIIHIATDITARKQAEEALHREKTFSDTMINSLPGIFYLFDEKGVFLRWNRNFEIVSGYSHEEIEKMSPGDFVSEEDRQSLEEAIQAVFAKGESHTEAYFLSKDGGKTPYYLTGLRFSWDNRPYLVGMGIDITERKRAEEEMHGSFFAQFAINMILSESLEDRPLEEILQKALNIVLSVPWLSFEAVGSIHLVEHTSGLLVMKAQYNLPEQLRRLCAYVSPGQCLCGKAALNRKIEFADHIDQRHEIAFEGMEPHGHYIVPILFGDKTLGVITIYLSDGHERDREEEEFLLAIADTLAGIIARRQGEEEREKLHAQLLQAQKMEAVGQLAGGIAHDFNNILTAMIGYAHLLKMKLKEEDTLRTYADNILSLSDKAAHLTQSLLTFSRKQAINPRPVDLNEIIRRVDHLLSRIIGEDILLQTSLSEQDLIVLADAGQIEQVLMNLAANARDAMPGGGYLTIGTEPIHFDSEFIREHGFGKEGPYALLSVTDTGAGIERDTSEHIFEPFFTTKGVGKGTGLGLSIVYGIVKQHDGYINVYSEPGKGTSFRIYFPVTRETMQSEDITVKDVLPLQTGTETILLAEDEAAVRTSVRKILEESGYKVIEATDGEDAVKRFRMFRDSIQLLIFDVIMPNRNGREAYEEIRKISPDIKVLFTSGYPADIVHKQGILDEGFDLLMKPASPSVLLGKIREVLG